MGFGVLSHRFLKNGRLKVRWEILASEFKIADCRLPIADCRLPIADCRLLIVDC